MKLIYLYHSGFALLGDDFTLIFDYWKDSESDGDGILHRELLKRPGRMYVFASHAHADHFNPEVLSWRLQRPDIVYLLSQDIQALHEAEQAEAVWLKLGDSYSDERLSVLDGCGNLFSGGSGWPENLSCRRSEQLALDG